MVADSRLGEAGNALQITGADVFTRLAAACILFDKMMQNPEPRGVGEGFKYPGDSFGGGVFAELERHRRGGNGHRK